MEDSNIPYEAFFLGAISSNKVISENRQYNYVDRIINYQKDRIIDYHNEKKSVEAYNYSSSEEIEDVVNSYSNILNIPINPVYVLDSRNYSRATYTWVGFVTAINKRTFNARVEDLKSNRKIYEDAEFEINDLDDEEIKMLRIGSILIQELYKKERIIY